MAANEQNPFAAAALDPVKAELSSDDFELVRQKHLAHESSIKALGVLYVLGGLVMAIWLIGMSLSVLEAMKAGSLQIGGYEILLTAAFLAAAVLSIFIGLGLRSFRPWSRILGIVFSAIGLLAIPIGTIIHGYFLYLFLSARGRMVFSPQYKEIIAATPHLKYRTSKFVWGLLALLIFVLIMLVVPALLLGTGRGPRKLGGVRNPDQSAIASLSIPAMHSRRLPG